MPLLIGHDLAGLEPKTRQAIDLIVAAIQVWAGKVDGINAAERLNELTTGVASLPTAKPGFGQVHFGATLPSGYLWCDGAAHSRTTYGNLFAEIGTTFGNGDGENTFNVPDMRQRFPLGKAASGTGSTLGSTGGSINHTHTLSGLTSSDGSHTHGAGTLHTVETDDPPFQSPTSPADQNVPDPNHVHDIEGSTGSDGAHTHGAGTLATGTANPPYLVCNWIIKT
jgi:microcystin-dependent protein